MKNIKYNWEKKNEPTDKEKKQTTKKLERQYKEHLKKETTPLTTKIKHKPKKHIPWSWEDEDNASDYRPRLSPSRFILPVLMGFILLFSVYAILMYLSDTLLPIEEQNESTNQVIQNISDLFGTPHLMNMMWLMLIIFSGMMLIAVFIRI